MPFYGWVIIGVLSVLLFIVVGVLCLVLKVLVALSQTEGYASEDR